ncbi:MAG: hypothetical protein ACREBC_26685, partial [Pyrinomonadaceae bacterium]
MTRTKEDMTFDINAIVGSYVTQLCDDEDILDLANYITAQELHFGNIEMMLRESEEDQILSDLLSKNQTLMIYKVIALVMGKLYYPQGDLPTEGVILSGSD